MHTDGRNKSLIGLLRHSNNYTELNDYFMLPEKFTLYAIKKKKFKNLRLKKIRLKNLS